jgi:hypothetical protein
MTRMLAVGLALALGGGLAAAPPAATPPSPDRLVEQLGSEAYEEREAAAAALEQLGSSATAALEAAVKNPNPEVSKRAARILTNLARAAETKGRFDAKPVRLSYKNIPLGTAVNDFKARTGINVTLEPEKVADPLRLITVDAGPLPPWEALAAFCQAAGLKEVFESELPVAKQERSRRGYYQPPPPPLPEAVPVKLADGTNPALPGSRSTAVRITALPGSFGKHRVYLGTGDVVLHFDVAPLPGLNWRDVSGIRITKLVDDAGRRGAGSSSKEPEGSFADFLDGPVFVGGAMAFDSGDLSSPRVSWPNPRIVPVPVRLATPSARSIKLLEGSVVCSVNLPNQPLVTIENIAVNPGQAVEGLRETKLTVLETKPSGKGGKPTIKLQIDSLPKWMESGNPRMMMWQIEQSDVGTVSVGSQVKAFDAAGKPLKLNVLSTSETSNQEFQITTTVQFSCPDGLPTKLVVMGSKPAMIEVPFRMENVPLP